jgi:hypothetical protein
MNSLTQSELRVLELVADGATNLDAGEHVRSVGRFGVEAQLPFGTA